MRVLALLSLLLLAGCSQQPAAPEVPIDELLRSHRYNSALDALQRNERDAPDYREQRRALLATARDWQRQLLAEIDELIARQQFAAAQLRLEGALPELPETPSLRRYAARFYERRDAFIASQTAALARLRGEHLLREQPLYEKLLGVDGDYRVRDAVERYREDSEYYAGKLREAGLRAIDASDWAEAADLLDIANRLRPDHFTAIQLASAQEQLRAAQGQQQSEQRQRERSQRSALRARFDDAMQHGDLERAATIMREAAQLSDAAFTRQLQQQLTQAQQATAAIDTEAGNRLYGEGNVEQAIGLWQRAQRFDDSVELQMKIDRAQRLLEHYRELQQQSRTPQDTAADLKR